MFSRSSFDFLFPGSSPLMDIFRVALEPRLTLHHIPPILEIVQRFYPSTSDPVHSRHFPLLTHPSLYLSNAFHLTISQFSSSSSLTNQYSFRSVSVYKLFFLTRI